MGSHGDMRAYELPLSGESRSSTTEAPPSPELPYALPTLAYRVSGRPRANCTVLYILADPTRRMPSSAARTGSPSCLVGRSSPLSTSGGNDSTTRPCPPPGPYTPPINSQDVPALSGPNHANSGRRVGPEGCRYALGGYWQARGRVGRRSSRRSAAGDLPPNAAPRV